MVKIDRVSYYIDIDIGAMRNVRGRAMLPDSTVRIIYTRIQNQNSLLVKRQNDNTSPGLGRGRLDGVSPSVFRCTSTPMETGPIDACVET